MERFLLLMRGDQEKFNTLTDPEKKLIINQHINFSKDLNKEGILVEGDGLSSESVLLSIKEGELSQKDKPYCGTENQLSGYYIIKAYSFEDAMEIAKKCPALIHGETVEVVKIGH
ncbi:MAG: hypothetical protein JXR48_13670 [Candidatus Delongbacteria bacterium]|nr:hypothetical protein [Candidatus Delongbacteria bacterium]MBN2836005.1 hypothetical protein [Candidatus Delongbacteria bacterium]